MENASRFVTLPVKIVLGGKVVIALNATQIFNCLQANAYKCVLKVVFHVILFQKSVKHVKMDIHLIQMGSAKFSALILVQFVKAH